MAIGHMAYKAIGQAFGLGPEQQQELILNKIKENVKL